MHKLSVVTLLVITAIFLNGCVVVLSSVATLVYMRSNNHLTTTVLIKKTPDAVYAAMNQIIDKTPNITIINKEDKKYLIEASRGENKVTAKATPYGSGLTQLIVTADAGKGDMTDEDLALKVVRQICDELGVEYKVIES
jgi:PBP1b-binding outer membrane lipoprotein LpoB